MNLRINTKNLIFLIHLSIMKALSYLIKCKIKELIWVFYISFFALQYQLDKIDSINILEFVHIIYIENLLIKQTYFKS